MLAHRVLSVFVMSFAVCCGAAVRPAPAQQPAEAAQPVTTTDPCPAIEASATGGSGGTCLEPDVLGDEVVLACADKLIAAGWEREPEIEEIIGGETGKRLLCFRHP